MVRKKEAQAGLRLGDRVIVEVGQRTRYRGEVVEFYGKGEHARVVVDVVLHGAEEWEEPIRMPFHPWQVHPAEAA
jgi:hypothetical protein